MRCCTGRGWELFAVACVLSVCVLQYCGYVCPVTASSLTRATAGGDSDVVDVYNGATGAWSTAQLSLARYYLAAASVGNMSLVAGGITISVLLCRDGVE